MAAIVQRVERLIVVQDVVGSNPTSRPIFLPLYHASLIPFNADSVTCLLRLVPAFSRFGDGSKAGGRRICQGRASSQIQRRHNNKECKCRESSASGYCVGDARRPRLAACKTAEGTRH